MKKYAYECSFNGEPGYYEIQLEPGRLMVEQWTPQVDQDTSIIPYEQYNLLREKTLQKSYQRPLTEQMRAAEKSSKENEHVHVRSQKHILDR